jgi:hypothetical protein
MRVWTMATVEEGGVFSGRGSGIEVATAKKDDVVW